MPLIYGSQQLFNDEKYLSVDASCPSGTNLCARPTISELRRTFFDNSSLKLTAGSEGGIVLCCNGKEKFYNRCKSFVIFTTRCRFAGVVTHFENC